MDSVFLRRGLLYTRVGAELEHSPALTSRNHLLDAESVARLGEGEFCTYRSCPFWSRLGTTTYPRLEWVLTVFFSTLIWLIAAFLGCSTFGPRLFWAHCLFLLTPATEPLSP